MSPRQFPSHPAVKAAGAVAILSMFLLGTDAPIPVASGAAPEMIAWRTEYNSAYFEARDGKRLIWVQFTGPWCPNCRRMERDSFPQAKVVERSRESFIPVKLRSDENEDLALRFNLTGLPATVIIDPANQTILTLQQGYLGPDELNALFDDVVARKDKDRKRSEAMLASTKSKDQEKKANIVKASTKPRVAEPKPAQPKPELAFSGYCPVSLVSTHKLVLGDAAQSLEHEGKLYRFANEKMRDLFRENPEKFLPVNRGHCPVAVVDREKTLPGDPRFGILYRERLYVCASREDRGKFLQDPERYALAHVEEKGYCPHCTQGAGMLVKGDPRFGLIRSGREYWFPDAEHRNAFLASLPGDGKTERR